MDIPGFLTVFSEWICCIIVTFCLEKKYDKIVFGGSSLVLILILIASELLPIEQFYSYIQDFPLLVMLFSTMVVVVAFKYLPMLVFFRVNVKGSWRNLLYRFSQTLVISEAITCYDWVICLLLMKHGIIHTTFDKQYVSGLLLLVFAAILFNSVRKGESSTKGWRIADREMGVSLLVAYICFAFTNYWKMAFLYSQRKEAADISDITISYSNQIAIGIMCITIYMSGMAILYLIKHISWAKQMNQEEQAINCVINQRYQQYLDYIEYSDRISKHRKSLRSQVESLRRVAKDKELEDYLYDLEESIGQDDFWDVTGNPVLDAILTQHSQICQKQQIKLEFTTDGSDISFLSIKDICSIFGNALDNAIEAVARIEEPGLRLIRGEIVERKQYIYFVFENCYEGSLEFGENGLPVSTKYDKTSHGFGLSCLQLATQKYKGTIKLSTEHQWFTLRILIPKP